MSAKRPNAPRWQLRMMLWPLAVLLVGAGVLAVLLATRPELEPENATNFYTSVRVQAVSPRSVTLSVDSQGVVQPRTESELVSEASGRVVWMSSALVSGGYFQEGEPLLRLDEADYRTAQAKAKAALVRARAEKQTTESEFQRMRRLQQQKLASQQQLEQAERNFRVAEAQLTESEANLEQARRDLTRTEISAPFSGRVRSERVDVGQFIARGESIATVYATDYVEVRLPVANRQLAYLDLPIGYRGQLDAAHKPPVIIRGDYAGQVYRWEGDIVRTEAEIDSESRMFYAVARIRNAPGTGAPLLVVGLFVQAQIIGRQVENVVVLPRLALRDGSRVLVVDDSDRLHFRDVGVLRIQHDEVLVDEGLAAGDRVVVSAMQVVVEGMKVQPLLESASERGALSTVSAQREAKSAEPDPSAAHPAPETPATDSPVETPAETSDSEQDSSDAIPGEEGAEAAVAAPAPRNASGRAPANSSAATASGSAL